MVSANNASSNYGKSLIPEANTFQEESAATALIGDDDGSASPGSAHSPSGDEWQSLYREIAEIYGVGGWHLNLETNELFWTSRTREIHEVDDDYVPNVEEAIGFYSEASQPVLREAIDLAISEKSSWDLELAFTTAKGRPLWVRAVGKAVFKDGRTVGLMGAFEDITARKRSEQKTIRSEAILQTTLASVNEGILLISPEGRILSCNTMAKSLLGCGIPTLVGKGLRDLARNCRFEDEQGHVLDNPFRAALDPTQRSESLRIKQWCADTAIARWLTLNAAPVRIDKDDVFEAVVLSISDITEVKHQADTLQATFDNFPGGIIRYDEAFNLRAYNQGFLDLVQYPPELMQMPRHILDILRYSAGRGDYGPGDPETLAQDRFKVMTSGIPHSYERKRPDGTVLEVRGTPLPDGGIVATVYDVTSHKHLAALLEDQVRDARERSNELQVILASMSQGVSVFNADERLTVWNQQYIDIFGKPAHDVYFKVPLRELIEAEKTRGEFDGDVDAHVDDLVDRMHRGEIVHSKFVHQSGKVISTIHTPLPGGGWIGTHEDVTAREVEILRIQHAAHHDMLTGLANRALFTLELERMLGQQRTGSSHGAALMLLDLDHFKPINDNHGHAAGDFLLKELAQRLKASLRSADIVARFGGDEFGVLAKNVEDRKVTDQIAERIINEFSAPVYFNQKNLNVGVSIGITELCADDTDIHKALKRADTALYSVKETGRNAFAYA